MDCFDKILDSCKYVVDNSKYVKINEDKINELVLNMDLIKPNHWLMSNPYGILNYDINELIHFLFIFGSIDCSFWGEPKWQIEDNGKFVDGAFGLLYVLTKIKKEIGYLDFTRISYNVFEEYFTGNIKTPLIKERYKIVREVSEIINNKFDGNIYEEIKDMTSDIDLFNFIVSNFSSFKDERTYGEKTIYFYKLAQLLTSDILHIRENLENIKVDYFHLVGCSDYKIPQVLRGLGILEYNSELSNLVDNKIEILENSKYEIEIRASMIIVINMIKEKVNGKMSAIEINDMIWGMGQDKSKKLKPYHLTRTLNY